MTAITKKIASAVATSAMLLSAATPAFANTSIEVSGNGFNSDNNTSVSTQSSTNVVQNNTAEVSNSVSGSTSTGGNKAGQNTGGDVRILTGDATSKVAIDNMLNSNKAKADCCGNAGDLDVLVSGNGAKSNNNVDVSKNSDTALFQTNAAHVSNEVSADASTGDNKASQNTGGDTLVRTGDAKTYVNLKTAANNNEAKIGGNGHEAGDTSVKVTGNGAYSDSDVSLSDSKNTAVVQGNVAEIYNAVWADASTGWNKADQNTGGDNMIYTGNAKVEVGVDNKVNFNWADVNCGCVTSDLLVKVAGNGSDSDQDVDVSNYADKSVFQDNATYLGNEIDKNAATGDNSIYQSTSKVNGDPAIWTGDAYTTTMVENEGGINTLGAYAPTNWSSMNSNMDLHFSFSLSDLMSFMGR